jgi:antitoxin VapB
MTRSTAFTSHGSQAVRLPRAVALPDGVRQVEIVKLGRSRLISPVGHSWDGFFGGDSPAVSDDFMRERGGNPRRRSARASDAPLHARHECPHRPRDPPRRR